MGTPGSSSPYKLTTVEGHALHSASPSIVRLLYLQHLSHTKAPLLPFTIGSHHKIQPQVQRGQQSTRITQCTSEQGMEIWQQQRCGGE